MSPEFQYSLLLVTGFLVGSIPSGVWFSKWKYRIDVREMGSGNIGATNITRTFGWFAGLLVLIMDFLKGFVPMGLLLDSRYGSELSCAIMGVGLVLGHCYSIFLRLRGGKGVATSLGVLMVLIPESTILAVPVYLLTLVLSRVPAVASLVGLAAFLTVVFLRETSFVYLSMSIMISAVIILRHRDNIVRLLANKPR